MGNYDDIINLPRHQSLAHKHMSMNDRAAQFLPFAALTGYDASILETARLTAEKKVLSNEDKLEISNQINILNSHIKERPTVYITHFVPDSKKDGGCYQVIEGKIKKIDDYTKQIIFENNVRIDINCIYSIKSSIIDEYQYIF